MPSRINQLHTYKSLELSSLPLSGMPRSTELNAGDCLVSTRLSYPKKLFFRSPYRHAVNTIEGKTIPSKPENRKNFGWKACIYLFICTYIYLTCDPDEEIIDFQI